MAKVQTLQGFLHRLVAGEAGPFMVPGGSAHSSQLQIGLRLMQPVGGTIHSAIVAATSGQDDRVWNLQAMALPEPPRFQGDVVAAASCRYRP
jgi:hypothetical protein